MIFNLDWNLKAFTFSFKSGLANVNYYRDVTFNLHFKNEAIIASVTVNAIRVLFFKILFLCQYLDSTFVRLLNKVTFLKFWKPHS